MLTDADRERIRQEEIFRAEVRSSLEPPSNFRKRCWKLANSAFGIWVLSSIVVGSISWQYSQYTDYQEKQARQAALLSKSKFDLLVLCDVGLSRISDKTKLSYNDISSAADLFRYEPGIPDEMGGHQFSVIEVLNELAPLSPSDKRVAAFRTRSYEVLRKANTILDNYRGWISSSDPDDPIYDVKLTVEQKKVIDEIKMLLEEMRTFAVDAS